MLLHLIGEVIFQLFGALKVFSVGRVVDAAVGEDSIHVGFEEMSCHVVSKMRTISRFVEFWLEGIILTKKRF